MRVNKERLKAAMAAADRAEAGAAAAPEDDVWSRLDKLMADADAITDQLTKFDLNYVKLTKFMAAFIPYLSKQFHCDGVQRQVGIGFGYRGSRTAYLLEHPILSNKG